MPKSAITPEAVAASLPLVEGEIVVHAVMVVATTRYDEHGRRVTRVSRVYPIGEVDGYAERGLLHTALLHSNEQAMGR